MPIAIGDIHGCKKELEQLVSLLPPKRQLIFLGDYIDRGPDSKGVIDFLIALSKKRDCVFLSGNHELMLLDALEYAPLPIVDGALDGIRAEMGGTKFYTPIDQWLANGGDETLKSYGVRPGIWKLRPRAIRDIFLGPLQRKWLYDLKYGRKIGNAIFVHAGLNPAKDIQKQTISDVVWIRDKFFRAWEHWKDFDVYFGHTVTAQLGLPKQAIFQQGRLYGIDTGCVFGGYLTAVDSETHEIWQVPGPKPKIDPWRETLNHFDMD